MISNKMYKLYMKLAFLSNIVKFLLVSIAEPAAAVADPGRGKFEATPRPNDCGAIFLLTLLHYSQQNIDFHDSGSIPFYIRNQDPLLTDIHLLQGTLKNYLWFWLKRSISIMQGCDAS